MPTIAEEILLLVLDDETGKLASCRFTLWATPLVALC